MPQIPLVQGGQRLDPSSPVPVSSADSSAGNLIGNAVEGFGKALSQLGAELDRAAKVTKAEEDRLGVAIAVNKAKFSMLEQQAIQNAQQVRPDDRADGFSGVQRFKEAADEQIGAIAETLSPDQKAQFLASIGDDVVRSSTLILADEVRKREEAIPLMRSENLQGKALLAFNDPQSTGLLGSEWEVSIREDNTISGEMKEKMILDGRREIARGAVNGMISRGAGGNASQFKAARFFVEQEFSSIFDDKERDHMVSQIRSAENEYNSESWSAYSRARQIREDRRKDEMNAQLDAYMDAYKGSGTGAKTPEEDKVRTERINRDPTLPQDIKDRLKQPDKTTAADDLVTNTRIFAKALASNNFTRATDEVMDAYKKNKLTNHSRKELTAALETFNTALQKDPTIKYEVAGALASLDKFKTVNVYDPETGTYRTNDDVTYNRAKEQLLQNVILNASIGNVSRAALQENLYNVVRDNYDGLTADIPVPGLAPSKFNTLEAANKTSTEMYADYVKNGKSWSPAKQAQVSEQLKQLKANVELLKKKDHLQQLKNRK